MGLDMSLTKTTRVMNYDFQNADTKFSIEVKKGGVPFTAIKPERVSRITEEIMYWRKANQIHKFFVDEVQGGNDNCRESWVPRGTLKKLVDLCEQVIASSELVKNENGDKVIKDPSKAMELLPCMDGFFFGSTDYDEWYLDDIKRTAEVLREFLEEECEIWSEIYYQSSW